MSIFKREGKDCRRAICRAYTNQVERVSEIVFTYKKVRREIAIRAQVKIAGTVGAVRIMRHHSILLSPRPYATDTMTRRVVLFPKLGIIFLSCNCFLPRPGVRARPPPERTPGHITSAHHPPEGVVCAVNHVCALHRAPARRTLFIFLYAGVFDDSFPVETEGEVVGVAVSVDEALHIAGNVLELLLDRFHICGHLHRKQA